MKKLLMLSLLGCALLTACNNEPGQVNSHTEKIEAEYPQKPDMPAPPASTMPAPTPEIREPQPPAPDPEQMPKIEEVPQPGDPYTEPPLPPEGVSDDFVPPTDAEGNPAPPPTDEDGNPLPPPLVTGDESKNPLPPQPGMDQQPPAPKDKEGSSSAQIGE